MWEIFPLPLLEYICINTWTSKSMLTAIFITTDERNYKHKISPWWLLIEKYWEKHGWWQTSYFLVVSVGIMFVDHFICFSGIPMQQETTIPYHSTFLRTLVCFCGKRCFLGWGAYRYISLIFGKQYCDYRTIRQEVNSELSKLSTRKYTQRM